MKDKKIKDERIVQITNKILSEAYFVVVLFLVISVVVKTYIMRIPFTYYITELGVIILSTIYIAIRSMLTGNNLLDTSKRSKKLAALAILGLSFVITIINGVKNYLHYGDKYTGIFDFHFLAVWVITFISLVTLIFVAFLFIYFCHTKGQQKVEKEINDDVETDGKE